MPKLEPASDPSMEDILASIRRIISDDDGGRRLAAAHLSVVETAAPVVHRPEAAPPVVLGRVDAIPEIRPSSVVIEQPIRAEPLINAAPFARSEATTAAIAEAARLVPSLAPVPVVPVPPASPLVEEAIPAAAAAPADAVSSEPLAPGAAEPTRVTTPPVAEMLPPGNPAALASANTEGLLSPRADAAIGSAFEQLATTRVAREPRTLDDLAREMLRPMLKDWLDDNLPSMVERLVREEIDRVSRGRR